MSDLLDKIVKSNNNENVNNEEEINELTNKMNEIENKYSKYIDKIDYYVKSEVMKKIMKKGMEFVLSKKVENKIMEMENFLTEKKCDNDFDNKIVSLYNKMIESCLEDIIEIKKNIKPIIDQFSNAISYENYEKINLSKNPDAKLENKIIDAKALESQHIDSSSINAAREKMRSLDKDFEKIFKKMDETFENIKKLHAKFFEGVVDAVKDRGPEILDWADYKFMDELCLRWELLLEAIEEEPETLSYLTALREDRDFALEAVKKNGLALYSADPAQQKDKEIALAAIKNNPEAMKYVDEEFRKTNLDFILDVINENVRGLLNIYNEKDMYEENDNINGDGNEPSYEQEVIKQIINFYNENCEIVEKNKQEFIETISVCKEQRIIPYFTKFNNER